MGRRERVSQLELQNPLDVAWVAAVAAFDELDDDQHPGVYCDTIWDSCARVVDEHVVHCVSGYLLAGVRTIRDGAELWWPNTAGGQLLRALHAIDDRSLTEL